MYGQMTAGSWIYIGTQGILQGTYETFARRGRQALRRHAGRHDHADRRPGRHGRRAAAGGDDERGRRHLRRLSTSRRITAPDRARLPRRSRPTRLDDAFAARGRGAGTQASAVHRRCSATPLDCVPQTARAVTRPSTSSPTRPRRTTRCQLPAGRASRSRTGTTTAAEDPEGFTGRARASMAEHVGRDGRLPGRGRRGVRLRQLDPRRGRAGRVRPGVRLPRVRAGLHPAAVLRGQGPVPLGRAVRATRRTSPPPTRRSSTCSPRTSRCAAVDHDGPGEGALPGAAGPDLLARLRRAATAPVWRFNDLVAARRAVSAPIVIGRDHLDCGSVASPYRETEAMADGSGRDRRLAAAERAGQHRVAVPPGCRSTTAAASASAGPSTPGR